MNLLRTADKIGKRIAIERGKKRGQRFLHRSLQLANARQWTGVAHAVEAFDQDHVAFRLADDLADANIFWPLRQALAAVIASGPTPAIHGVVRWRLIDLCHWLRDEFKVTLAKQTLSRELRAMGYRKLSARPRAQ